MRVEAIPDGGAEARDWARDESSPPEGSEGDPTPAAHDCPKS